MKKETNVHAEKWPVSGTSNDAFDTPPRADTISTGGRIRERARNRHDPDTIWKIVQFRGIARVI